MTCNDKKKSISCVVRSLPHVLGSRGEINYQVLKIESVVLQVTSLLSFVLSLSHTHTHTLKESERQPPHLLQKKEE